MKTEQRTAVYDNTLHIEAYRLKGITQPFPNHFHEYYVLGLIEEGTRTLSCGNQTYTIGPGSLLLFAPGDSHSCTQISAETLDYRGFNIIPEIFLELAGFSQSKPPPIFSQNAVQDTEIACCFRSAHERIMSGNSSLGKEEGILLLITQLFQRYVRPTESPLSAWSAEIEKVCAYMESNYAGHISLDQLCRVASLSKSTLLRAFTQTKGVTPYSYLENIRISHAKKLLEQGIPPAEAALCTGFSDQSHFTNYFSRYIGLPPGAYRGIFTKRSAPEKQ